MTTKALDVTIMGREFRVSCPEEEEEALLEAVHYLDERMHDIRQGGKIIGIERIAIMAALNITHEFLSLKMGNSSVDVQEIRRRMKSMEEQLDRALNDQESLF